MDDERLEDLAPQGQVWVCEACGKYAWDRYCIGDVSCYANAVLCYDDATLKIKNKRVVKGMLAEENDA